MDCPHCAAPDPNELGRRTALGYRTSNERTGTPFNHLAYPTDVVLLVVRWRLQSSLSLRDLAAMFLERGIVFTHEAAREWEERFAPLLAERLRARRRGKAGRKWYVDETYVRVHGRLCYLYHAIDRDGNLVDSMLSEHRDMEAARRFFARAIGVVGHAPAQLTTDGHTSYPRASHVQALWERAAVVPVVLAAQDTRKRANVVGWAWALGWGDLAGLPAAGLCEIANRGALRRLRGAHDGAACISPRISVRVSLPGHEDAISPPLRASGIGPSARDVARGGRYRCLAPVPQAARRFGGAHVGGPSSCLRALSPTIPEGEFEWPRYL